MTRTLALCLLFLLMAAPSGPGRSSPGAGTRLCDSAAADAADAAGVPLPILRAILLAESGRAPADDPGGALEPWPWTVRAGAQGHVFDSAAAAEAFALDRLRAGEDAIDLGCFQIGWRWHGAAFGSVDRMLDPMLNARYAADLLASLHRQSGDWRQAAGAYHSPDPARAEAYVLRLETLHAAGSAAPPPTPSGGRGPLIHPPGGPLIGAAP